MRTVKAWSINVVWSDDTEETRTDIPNWAAREIDQWLDELEAEEMQDEQLFISCSRTMVGHMVGPSTQRHQPEGLG